MQIIYARTHTHTPVHMKDILLNSYCLQQSTQIIQHRKLGALPATTTGLCASSHTGI